MKTRGSLIYLGKANKDYFSMNIKTLLHRNCQKIVQKKSELSSLITGFWTICLTLLELTLNDTLHLWLL